MSAPQGQAVGGSCLGGVVDLIVGILLGGLIGSGSHSDLPKNGPIDPKPIDGCLGFFGMVLGAGIGGVVGALGGSILGAGLATRSQKVASDTVADRRVAQVMDSQPSTPEASETELARLKARIAELEEKTRNNDPP
ncbi:MAG TPA: hypothetical protein VN688_26045 [Gemmataceae bacterium]|nr:hypothetical protein [Gemmataceae bacterium]